MKIPGWLKYVGFAAIFVLLGLGYSYFSEQSLLTSGRVASEKYIDALSEGDTRTPIEALNAFVGLDEGVATSDPQYANALTSINFVSEAELSFVSGDLARNDTGDVVYSAIYSLPAEGGTEDFFILVLRRDGTQWKLANAYLSATDPFTDSR